ncbi:Uncharacterised protein r2_g823 [Pycnogonum litorale]
MSTLLGGLESFDSGDFAVYLERLEEFFLANSVGVVREGADAATFAAVDRKKIAVLLSMIGKDAYATARDLCLPIKPSDKSYTDLSALLKQHFRPKVLEVAETYRFHHTIQSENESISDYVNRLKRQATNCNFGSYYNRALRDQLICGVRDHRTKTKLLSENRTFEQAVDVAVAMETAQKEPKTLLSHPDSAINVVRIKSKPNSF